MKIEHALLLARHMMDEHGLTDWAVAADHARRRAGQCREHDRTLTLSRHLIPLYSHEDVCDVILHEIAHAQVGAKHGHDRVWKERARAIGARPEAHLSKDLPKVAAPWVGRCPNGHSVDRFRRPSKPVSCAQCSPHFDRRYLLKWSRS